MRKPTRSVSRPVHRVVTRDELRSERDSRPGGKSTALPVSGAAPDSLLLFDSEGLTFLHLGMI